MTIRYLIEADVKNYTGTVDHVKQNYIGPVSKRYYIGLKASTRTVPHLFSSPDKVRQVIAYAKQWRASNFTITVLTELEKGFANVKTFVYTEEQFAEFKTSEFRKPHNPNAVFYVERFPASDDKPAVFVKNSYYDKAPRRFNRAGDVRSHIHASTYGKSIPNQVVLEVVYDKDGITPISTKRWPMLEFLLISKDSSKWVNRVLQQAQRNS